MMMFLLVVSWWLGFLLIIVNVIHYNIFQFPSSSSTLLVLVLAARLMLDTFLGVENISIFLLNFPFYYFLLLALIHETRTFILQRNLFWHIWFIFKHSHTKCGCCLIEEHQNTLVRPTRRTRMMFYENKNMKISCVNRVEHSDNIIHTYSYILHAVWNNKMRSEWNKDDQRLLLNWKL